MNALTYITNPDSLAFIAFLENNKIHRCITSKLQIVEM